MQPHEKSVKLPVDCLFTNTGSGKPLCLNKREQFTPYEREPSQAYYLTLVEIFQTSY
jgi:hypothetical protein